MLDPYLQQEAEIVERTQDAPDIFTLKLRFTDPEVNKAYSFHPGQFNMIYLYGIGEVAISIVSNPEEHDLYFHTIRAVGRITKGLADLKEGDRLGVRGPFGRGWPLEEARNKDVIIVTGGLGCAPVVAGINYIVAHRDQYRKLKILQGVKHTYDFIFRERYAEWEKTSDAEVIISADHGGPQWPWGTGFVTERIKTLDFDADNVVAMLCGPEPMMNVAAKSLLARNVSEDNIYLSMERSMHCGVGHCGHCQFGGEFVCKDGPVFTYGVVKNLLGREGF